MAQENSLQDSKSQDTTAAEYLADKTRELQVLKMRSRMALFSEREDILNAIDRLKEEESKQRS